MSNLSSAQLPAHLSLKSATFALTDIVSTLSILKECGDEVAGVMFLDGYYELCSKHVSAHGGEMIKYEGDASLSMFPESEIESAIAALVAIRDEFPEYCRSMGVTPTDIKGAVHTGEAVTGHFGPEKVRDVLGKTINVLFSLESRGITLSEQVYRKLPSDKRGPFKKHGGHVTYVMK